MAVPRDFASTRIVLCFTGRRGCIFHKTLPASTISKEVDSEENPGLAKLPTDVRNKMGYMKDGGPIGLYANINAKKKRIAAGSGEKMRKPGSKGAPTAQAFINSAKTAKK